VHNNYIILYTLVVKHLLLGMILQVGFLHTARRHVRETPRVSRWEHDLHFWQVFYIYGNFYRSLALKIAIDVENPLR
jgi:hypothetical protein